MKPSGLAWFVLAGSLALGACGGEGASSNPLGPSSTVGAGQPGVPAIESVDECRDFTNIEFGDVEPASIEAVRAAYPDAEEPADGERWVQIAVAGNWSGITQAWVQYNLSFTLLTPSGETFWQPRGQPENTADNVDRIDAYQYYLVRNDEDELVLACSTIDGDFPLRNARVSPEN